MAPGHPLAMTSLTRFIIVATATAVIAGAGASPAVTAPDRRECAAAQFAHRWDALDALDTGFPDPYGSHIQKANNFFLAYSDGTFAYHEDYPSRGWTLVKDDVGPVRTEPVYDAEFTQIGTREYRSHTAEYARVDPALAIDALATLEHRRVVDMRRAWMASRAGIVAHSRAHDDPGRRWLIRRGRAFLASARVTQTALLAAAAAPIDVVTVNAAVHQTRRLDTAAFWFRLRFPSASLFACYR